ncbi:hypothetical protein HDU92_003235 [Lobulomyces angularis]|nr:hypothetical protein HDU92_003235 [Lobulomyces angularis]
MGYVDTGSYLALAVGFVAGTACFVGANLVSQDSRNCYLVLGVAGGLMAMMGHLFSIMGTFYPVGLYSTISMIVFLRPTLITDSLLNNSVSNLKNVEQLKLNFEALRLIHIQEEAKVKYYRDITDFPQKFFTKSDIEDYNLEISNLKQEFEFSKRQTKELGNNLETKVKSLCNDVIKVESISKSISELEKKRANLEEEKVEIEKLSTESMDIAIQEKLNLIEKLTNRNLELISKLENPLSKNSALNLNKKVLSEEIELKLNVRLTETKNCEKEKLNLIEKTDPRIEEFGSWLNKSAIILKSINGLKSIETLNDNETCIEFLNTSNGLLLPKLYLKVNGDEVDCWVSLLIFILVNTNALQTSDDSISLGPVKTLTKKKVFKSLDSKIRFLIFQSKLRLTKLVELKEELKKNFNKFKFIFEENNFEFCFTTAKGLTIFLEIYGDFYGLNEANCGESCFGIKGILGENGLNLEEKELFVYKEKINDDGIKTLTELIKIFE